MVFHVQKIPVPYMLKSVRGYKASLYIQVVELGKKIIVLYSSKYIIIIGTWGSVVVKALCCWLDGPRIDSWWCHWGFFSMVLSDKTMCPEVDSENEYQEFLLG
jgi:hypothetical protein